MTQYICQQIQETFHLFRWDQKFEGVGSIVNYHGHLAVKMLKERVDLSPVPKANII